VKIVAGDYQEKQLGDAMQKGSLTADIVRTWQKNGARTKRCVWCGQGSRQINSETVRICWRKFGYQDAETLPDERREIKRKFHNGDIGSFEYPNIDDRS